MSFNTNVKEDLISTYPDSDIRSKLELEAIFRFSGEVVYSNKLRLDVTLSNMGIMRHFLTLCKKYYTIETEIQLRTINRFDNKTTFTCQIINGADVIIKDLNLLMSESLYRKNELTQEDEIYYVKGAFLARGSVNDPMSKNNHFEISTTVESEILYIQKILNHYDLNARISKRKNLLIVYLKSREHIADVLYRLGARSSYNYYQNAIITKDIAASAHREVNLDLANQDKTNKAALEQLKIIEYLEYNYPLQNMDSKLLMVMKVRKENKESSLTELLEIIHDDYEPNLTKSGLNHRFRKLKEIYLEFKALKEKD